MTKKIILADDDAYVREALVPLIHHTVPGVEVVQVTNGRDLVARVRDGGFALVLTDNNMPDVGGLEAIREIREFDSEVPVYMLSSSGIEKEALAAGATGFMVKTNCFYELPPVLHEYLG
ncbi:response regulator transcription factor [Candidatus Woesearchaeota archaeon]|nr:response regulator transcription factor [Candidatus Woesearchaeota archaeon]